MSNAILLAGLGFGDESKGATVDWLTRLTGAHTVVRYNGGAQAGHNVVTADGRHHTFAQFGSGTFAGAKTHLSRHMLVNPIFLLTEGKHLQAIGEKDIFDRITVDQFARITNPFQVSANRIREMARDGGRHGSCGMGIGETVADTLGIGGHHIQVRDLVARDSSRKTTLRRLLERSRERKIRELNGLHSPDCIRRDYDCICPFASEWGIIIDPGTIDLTMSYYAEFVDRVSIVPAEHLSYEIMNEGTTIFEGAQGMLLDQDYGFHPYTTWTDITFRNAYELLGIPDDEVCAPTSHPWEVETGAFHGQVRRIGVLRTHHTRHGAGPFPTEDPTFMPDPREHNCSNHWQQSFRTGHFDLCMARYALEAIGGVNELALSHLDRIQDEQKVCVQYRDAKDRPAMLMKSPMAWEMREDLELRTSTTTAISNFKPVYRTLNFSPEGFATEIAKLLGVKIGSLAYGPTAEDRRTA